MANLNRGKPVALWIHTTDENSEQLPVGATNPVPTVASAVPPSAANKATFVRGTKIPAAIATPERIAAVGTYVHSVTIIGQRAARVPNTSSVWIDAVATNDGQLIELTPGTSPGPGINGSSYTLTAPPGKVIDLGDIYVDSETLGDGVSYLGYI